MKQGQQVMIAMSGGVDSSVCTILLQKQGYVPYGATLYLYDAATLGLTEGGCGADSAVADARRVAETLGIPFAVYSEKELFEEKVLKDFWEEYAAGRTPNPCIRCNRFVKFSTLFDHATALGIPYLATGHYARVAQDEKTGRWLLLRGREERKDQSYVLYNLKQEQLSRLLLPVGEYTKEEIRQFAEEAGLHNAQKKDSQDICFVPDGDYMGFLKRWAGCQAECGDFVDTHGKVLGQHKGQMAYTLGQRKGLGISSPTPLYVVDKDLERNQVILGQEADVYRHTVWAKDWNWIAVETISEPLTCTAKTRYRQKEAVATVYPEENGLTRVVFETAQRAPTAGQAIVLYDGERVVGGGTIVSSER